MAAPFLPVCREEMEKLGWSELDILFVTGDAYVDHPSFGVPLLARLLESKGYRVGILAQPRWKEPACFQAMGRPRLFVAISAGAMDSMVNHYTANKKVRNDDAYTPGGRSGARPNRAVIAYTAAVKGAFKGLPVVIGGIEASLRRLAHYDYWSDAVRRSVLADSKADLLVYGMGESALVEIAARLSAGQDISELRDIRGTARLSREVPEGALVLPSFDEVSRDTRAYGEAFRLAALEANPFCARTLAQEQGGRYVVVNPPALPLAERELDRVYALPFSRRPHPSYKETIPAYEQIRHSITSHRGCFGGCAFCAITHHQGKIIQSRSEASILGEIDRMVGHPDFRGTISDVGGPTANMYGLHCSQPEKARACRRAGCLHPSPCKHLATGDKRALNLLRKIRQHRGVKHVFVASGVRYDLLEAQPGYMDDLVRHHVGGLLKVAPEAVSEAVTSLMRKPGVAVFEAFLEKFRAGMRAEGKRCGVVPYFIAGHPGSRLKDMVDAALFLQKHQLRVEQAQEFTPTPGTLSTCIWHTGLDPFTGEAVYVPKGEKERKMQKALLLWHLPESKPLVREALRCCGREEEGRALLSSAERGAIGRVRARGQR